MNHKDPLVEALVSLCRREGGHDKVAKKALVSADNLWQIINGTKLPSGNPRGVGPKLRAALSQAYADWLSTKSTGTSKSESNLGVPRPATIKYAHRAGVVQGGDNGFIEPYLNVPTLQDPEPIAYVATKSDEQAYAVKVRGNSMEPTIMAGWDVVASPSRSAEPPDLCVVHFANERKALKRLVWVRAGMVCLESLNSDHRKITEPVENIIRMDKVISIVPN